MPHFPKRNQALLTVFHPSTLIAPLTTNLSEDAYPLRIRIKAQDQLQQESDLLIDQIRAIDNKRLKTGPLTRMAKAQLQQIYKAVCEVMGMPFC